MPAQSQSSKSATAAATASSSGTSSGVDAPANNSRAARQGASTSCSSSIGLTHHPYRIEVQQVSPVSISLRWSLRPPPISQLRNSKRTRREVNGDGADATEKAKDAAEGQGAGEGAAENDDEDGDDDEDDDATAVDGSASERDEDFADSRPGPAAASPSSNRTAPAGSNPYRMTKIFEDGVSVTVNGAVWSQVVMADQGYDEAVIVIYGLEPNRAYDVEMSVGGPDSKRNVILSTSAATASVPEEATAQVEATGAPSAPCSEHGHASGSATPTASGSTSALAAAATADRSNPSLASGAQQELLAAQELRNSLNAELRQARRDASRAEQALRNEIEAIKRSLERMSSVDHRSKQKVLALQESIRQANQSAKDIAEEAEQTEKEHPKGEERARKLGEEEAKKRGEVEEIEAGNDAQVKREEETTAAAEKELAGLQKALASRQGDVEKLQSGRIAELERDVARLQAESDRINNSATPPPPAPPAPQQLDARGGRGPFDPQAGGSGVPASGSGAYRSVSAPRGRGQSGRGGASGGSKQRNASGPHSFHHRRGGRGGAANSAGGNVAPPPFGLDHGTYLASGFANPNAPTTAIGTTPSPSGLNPASSDFIPSSSSTHASPIIAKNAGGGGMPPGIGGVGPSVIGRGSGGGLSSGPNSASHGSHHESPTAVHPQFGPAGGQNSFAPRLDSPTSASPFAAGPIGPPYHHHHPAYHQHHPHNAHLSALAATNASSVFDSSSSSINRRRPSGPLDFDDDAAFDPTRAGSISPSFGAAPGSGSSRFMPSAASTSSTSAASPWSTAAPAAGLTAASVGSPWAKASSPLLGTGSGLPSSATGTAGAGVGGPGSDEIWGVNVSPSASTLPAASLRPQVGVGAAGGGGFHPLYPQQPPHPPPSSIFAHSHSPFGHPHRSASGSSASASASTHNSGSAGTPTSPTAPTGLSAPGQQRLGSGSGSGGGAGGGFGAIGGGAGGGAAD